MKFALALALLPVLAGTATAQNAPPTGDSVVVETIKTEYSARPRNPMLTAADSARERARLENARQLRKAGRPPAKPLGEPGGTVTPNAPTATPLLPPAVPAAPASPASTELERNAKRREEAARKAAKAEEQRQKTLYKRAKKNS